MSTLAPTTENEFPELLSQFPLQYIQPCNNSIQELHFPWVNPQEAIRLTRGETVDGAGSLVGYIMAPLLRVNSATAATTVQLFASAVDPEVLVPSDQQVALHAFDEPAIPHMLALPKDQPNTVPSGQEVLPSSSGAGAARVTGGERVTNLRQLLSRPSLSAFVNSDGAGSQTYTIGVPINSGFQFRCVFRTDCGRIEGQQANSTGDTPFFDFITFFGLMFRASRGPLAYYVDIMSNGMDRYCSLNSDIAYECRLISSLTYTTLQSFAQGEWQGEEASRRLVAKAVMAGADIARPVLNGAVQLKLPPYYTHYLERVPIPEPLDSQRAQQTGRPKLELTLLCHAKKDGVPITLARTIAYPSMYVYRSATDDFAFGFPVGPIRLVMASSTWANLRDTLGDAAGYYQPGA